MLTYDDLEYKNARNATANARDLKPRVKVLDFGKFEVRGRRGDLYIVTFHVSPEGDHGFDCDCPAHTKGGRACYHVAACLPLYLGQQRASIEVEVRMAQVEEEIAVEMAAQVATCRDCRRAPIASTEGRCRDCQAAKDREDIFG